MTWLRWRWPPVLMKARRNEMSAFWNWFVQASCWQVLGNALTLALALVIIGIGIGEAVRYIRISWKG